MLQTRLEAKPLVMDNTTFPPPDDSILFPGIVPCGQIPILNIPKGTAYVASVSLMVQISLLAITFIVGHVLRRKKILIIPEAGAALGFGVLVGLVVTFARHATEFRSWINFNNNFFFYFLLPPIIFQSGWELKSKTFFDNFGAICSFAFGGTFISTFVVGFMMYGVGQLHWAHEMPILVCLTFGALISATDPVTVLAIFHELGVDPNLYAAVFGESVLNDAVAIVLYRTILSFIANPISNRGIFAAIWFFVVIFVGSFSIGVIVGLFSAMVVKYGGLHEKSTSLLQSCLVVLFPYMAYMAADALELSGIVAILFTGITMKYYAAPNLSEEAKEITGSFFAMLAKLSETFVFIYMGVAMFLEEQSWHDYGFTLFTVLSIFVARLFNIYPLAFLVNKCRPAERKIPFNHQHVLWFGGLRGAMAFALALEAVNDLPNNYGRVMLTSTLFTVVFTVLTVGGTTPYLLRVLKVECNVHNHDEIQVSEEGLLTHKLQVDPDDQKHDIEVFEKFKLQKKLRKLKEQTSFATIDQKFLTPFFGSVKPTDSANWHESDGLGVHDQTSAKNREVEMTTLADEHNLYLEPVSQNISLLSHAGGTSESLTRRTSAIPI